MTHDQYISMIYASLIGIFFQLLYKAIKLKKKAKETNEPWSLGIWIATDYLVLIANITAPFAIVFIFDEFVVSDEGIEEKYLKYIKSLFLFVGFTGSALLMGFFSLADKKLSKIIDTKTNLADFGSEAKPDGK